MLYIILLSKIIFAYLIRKWKFILFNVFSWPSCAWLNQLLINWYAGAMAAKLQCLFYEIFTLVNQIVEYYFLVSKIMHNFKIGFKFDKYFVIPTYILAVFKGETSKVILFSKIYRFLRSMTQNSIRTDLIKK